MSTPNPPVPPAGTLNLEQQHKLAKDLIAAARGGDAAALARIRAVRSDAAAPRAAAEARRRAAGRGPRGRLRLVAEARGRAAGARRQGVPRRGPRAATSPRTQQLLALDHVRKRINDPMFDFGQRAAHIAAKNAAMLATLIAAGADVNLKSDWENGPYTVLDNADEDTRAIPSGARRDADAERGGAARLVRRAAGARERRRERSFTRAEETASSRSTRRRPSRLPTSCWTAARASTCGASITSPRPRSTRWSIARTSAGACSSAGPRPTSSWRPASGTSRSRRACWTPIRPALAARINEPGYPPVPPFNIYCWSIGFGMSPHEVALRFGHRDVHDLLAARSPARVRFMNALLAADERRRTPGPR